MKVLDFGLAKAMEPPAGSSLSMSMSPTITAPAMTQAGMILGTAADRAPDDPDRFGVMPDAQRFLVLTTTTGENGAASTPPMTVVLNYAQALKR